MSTWAEFVAGTKELLPADADRQGLETYVNRVIRQGVINIQSDIPLYRKGHETIFTVDDVITAGHASIGNLPEQSEPRDIFFVKENATCTRQPVWKYDWGNRYDLICGRACLNGCQFAIAFDPQATQFIIYPRLTTGRQLSFFWDGRKLDFDDDESVPFDERVELADSLFASAHIARKTNHDLNEYNSYMADFTAQKRVLFLDAQDRTRIKEQALSLVPQQTCPPCSTCIPTPSPPVPPAGSCCGLALLGHGSPEGVVVGQPGQWYINIDTYAMWMKLTGADEFGWFQESGPFE